MEQFGERIRHYKLVGHEAVPCGLYEWGRFLREGQRIVAQDDVGSLWVSTVFLGLDHNHFGKGPPLIFETMVFPQDKDGRVRFDEQYMERCSTWAEAKEQHKKAVEWARNNQPKET